VEAIAEPQLAFGGRHGATLLCYAGMGSWLPGNFRSIFGYVFPANGSRYAGFFAVEANTEDEAGALQKEATGTGVTVRYDPENPDVSILEDGTILGRRLTQNPHWLP